MKLPPLDAVVQDLCVAAALVVAAALLAACDGSDAGPHAMPGAADSHVEPLFDDRGNPIVGPQSAAEPADPLARSRLGRYATRDQYAREQLVHRHRTVLIDLDAATADAAVLAALHIGYWHDAPAEVNFFVRSRDAHAAASLANTLAEFGYLRVFVIV